MSCRSVSRRSRFDGQSTVFTPARSGLTGRPPRRCCEDSARHRRPIPEQAKIQSLTRRELEVVALIGIGLKNEALAARLSISQATVRNHLTSILLQSSIWPTGSNWRFTRAEHGLVDEHDGGWPRAAGHERASRDRGSARSAVASIALGRCSGRFRRASASQALTFAHLCRLRIAAAHPRDSGSRSRSTNEWLHLDRGVVEVTPGRWHRGADAVWLRMLREPRSYVKERCAE